MRYPAGDQCPECGSRLHLEGNTDAGEDWYSMQWDRELAAG